MAKSKGKGKGKTKSKMSLKKVKERLTDIRIDGSRTPGEVQQAIQDIINDIG